MLPDCQKTPCFKSTIFSTSAMGIKPKAYFNICNAFAPPGPLLAPPLRKNCPTSNWANLKKFNFMHFIKNTEVHLITQAKIIASSEHSLWSPHRRVVYNTKHYWKQGADALVAAEAMHNLYYFITLRWRHLCFSKKQPSESKKCGNEERIEKEKMPQSLCLVPGFNVQQLVFFHCHLQLKDKVSKNQYSQQRI